MLGASKNEHGCSVVIPTANGRLELKEAIDSALNQSVSPLEIIIVDDGKFDHDGPYIEQRMSNNVWVKRIHDPTATSAGGARNIGWRASQGAWVAFLDDDDFWQPNLLAEVENCCSDGSIDAIIFWMNQIKPNGHVLPGKGLKENLSGEYFLARNPGITGSNLVMKRSILEHLGGFDETLQVSEDKDIMIRFLHAGYRYRVIDKRLVTRRIGRGDHLTLPSNPRQLEGLIRFRRKYRNQMNLIQRIMFAQKTHAAAAGCKHQLLPRVAHRVAGFALGDRYALFR